MKLYCLDMMKIGLRIGWPTVSRPTQSNVKHVEMTRGGDEFILYSIMFPGCGHDQGHSSEVSGNGDEVSCVLVLRLTLNTAHSAGNGSFFVHIFVRSFPSFVSVTICNVKMCCWAVI